MKLRSALFFIAAIIILTVATGNTVSAQQYKLRQSTNMAGMKTESTIYVKGMRKRTEGGGFGTTNIITIEQCDSQRTIKINDKKRLYYIEPFSRMTEEITEDDVKPAVVKNKPVTAAPEHAKKKRGGIINIFYNITDTGERKKMYGLTARHVWSTQKIKPSADACMMKDSMIIKTDGWYIDLPQFNCPVNSFSGTTANSSSQYQPECKDRFVSKRSGKGKLGFPLTETRTMIMGNGNAQTNKFETSLETLEFSTMKLDSMLFEIPLGYQQAKTEEELQDKFDVNDMIRQAGNRNNAEERTNLNEPKRAGVIRIGVYEPKGDEQLQGTILQQHLVNKLTDENIEAVAIASEEDAKKYDCDLILTTEFTRVKQGSKIGGLLKAIKNTDPSASSSYNIEANLTLVNLSDGAERWQQKVDGKYDGKADDAAMKALDKGCGKMLKELK